jgi:hypothetical protein
MITIKDNSVVDDLSDEAKWGLGSEAINLRHVQIVHEEYHVTIGSGSKYSTRTFVDIALDYSLKGFRVGVGVEVHGGIDTLFSIEDREVVLNDGGLACTGNSDVENSLVN